jgi:hypothetical protein
MRVSAVPQRFLGSRQSRLTPPCGVRGGSRATDQTAAARNPKTALSCAVLVAWRGDARRIADGEAPLSPAETSK